MTVTPAEEYTERLLTREARAAQLEKQHARIATARLVLAVAILIAAWFSLQRSAFFWGWLGIPAAGFIGIALYHSNVRRAWSRALRAAAVYRNGLARMQDRWAGSGQRGERFEDPHHVYAADLDLFGKGGLFELLCTARTRMGEETLAQWLLSPASVTQIQERHAGIAELRTLVDLREALAVLGDEPDIGVQPGALLQWAEAPNSLQQRWLRWLAPALGMLSIATAVVWGIWDFATPFLAVLLIEGGIAYSLRRPLNEVLHGTEHAFEDLQLLAQLLARIEREHFQAPGLRALMQELASHGVAASQAIARLRTIVQFVESRRNPLLRLLDVPLMYSVQAAMSAQRWRQAHGRAIRSWLKVTGEVETLISLGAYSYEHPADCFPEFVAGPASFNGLELGHPLLPAASCVRNTVSIGRDAKVLLVSGSNMSGKSTLLRTIGINTVLAMAGAPVRARALQLTALQVGASIRVNDSLHDGSSRFFAEITRLRQIHDLSGRSPSLLFLSDELLQGTNSADRRVGAAGVMRALVKKGAIGLISTHDLALTDIDGIENFRLHNVHFQDELQDGKIEFDFKLREGVVTKSNGLQLMRSIGLDV